MNLFSSFSIRSDIYNRNKIEMRLLDLEMILLRLKCELNYIKMKIRKSIFRKRERKERKDKIDLKKYIFNKKILLKNGVKIPKPLKKNLPKQAYDLFFF